MHEHIGTMLMLACAVSLDGFGVGFTYGLRDIHIPFLSAVVISLCSGTVMFSAMMVGHVIAKFCSEQSTTYIGGSVLILIGLWTLFQQLYSGGVKLLQSPQDADKDHSGRINSTEAFVLGFALSVDSLGSGIGAAFVGFSPSLVASIVCISCGLFMNVGLYLGKKMTKLRKLPFLSLLPGLLLITIGIMKIV